MKTYLRYLLSTIILLFLNGCCADLVVENVEVTWNDTTKNARAIIKNRSSFVDANNFEVYFDADENPVSPNKRPHVSHNVTALAAGDHIQLEADFAPLAAPENNYLGNVYQITVTADPKNTVRECNEDNNNGGTGLPPGPSVIIDPYNLVPSGNWMINTAYSVKQNIIISHNAQLIGIELALLRCTAPDSAELVVQIGQGTTVIGTATLAAAQMPGQNQCGVVPPPLDLATTSQGFFDFSDQNINLQSGQTYFFNVYGTTGADIRVGDNVNGYADGSALHNDNPTNHDLVFKIMIQLL